jgi:hypothetical protein
MAGPGERGKLIWACGLRRKPEIEAGFLRAYGIDVIHNPPTPRRMVVLYTHLPPGVVVEGDKPESWSQEAHLLASVIDSINMLTTVTLKAAGAKNVSTPKAIPRPGGSKTSRAPGAKTLSGGFKELEAVLAGTPGVSITTL